MVQPADVAWMHLFELRHFEKWQHWLLHEPKYFTRAGNLMPPEYARAITWISEIQAAFDITILLQSFDQCGNKNANLDD